MFARLIKCEDGATAIEYGLISAIIAVALISGFGAFSNSLSNQLVYLSDTMNNSWK
jgi:pilus assembly protein Flp/PilA